ncbi:MAG: DUF456 domain-containing protein [Chitinophagales bacterium]|nr:DUF456 domain-containing protein [Chitinophagales bacterium]MDW8394354.1 DUF456 domain-containing protein [Chitinophagales bacterium]
MEVINGILALVLTAIGLLGCVLPGLPGLPLNYAALLLVQWQWKVYSVTFLIVMAVLTAVVLVLDYLIPAWSAKWFGATPQGVRGSILGMIVGLFFTPVGMIFGILLGAILGDMAAGRKPFEAMRSGVGTLFGTLTAMALKILLALVMAVPVFWHLVRKLWDALAVAFG